MAQDEAHRIALADYEIVLRSSVSFEIVERTARSAIIVVTCRTVNYPLVHPSAATMQAGIIAQIRDLEEKDGSVILDL